MAVTRLFVRHGEKHSLIYLEDSSRQVEVPAGWEGLYYPAYVPEGFHVDEMSEKDALGPFITWRNQKDDQFIRLMYFNKDARTMIDTENSVIEEITLPGGSGFVATRADRTSVVWHDQHTGFVVASNLPREEVLRIAYSVIRIRE